MLKIRYKFENKVTLPCHWQPRRDLYPPGQQDQGRRRPSQLREAEDAGKGSPEPQQYVLGSSRPHVHARAGEKNLFKTIFSTAAKRHAQAAV